jgi:hypothetical protein
MGAEKSGAAGDKDAHDRAPWENAFRVSTPNLQAGRRKKILSPNPAQVVALCSPAVTSETPALAVIDGTLCQLTRRGARAVGHTPLATAVVEFRHRPFRCFVREHPFGLLPGLPNLYCLDGEFRLLWLAEWPESAGPCTAILEESDEALVAQAASGAIVRLDAATGRMRSVEPALAAAS